jgi:hypothetical protein
MNHLNEAFDHRVIALPEVHDGNRVAIAFAGPALDVPFAALNERAGLLEAQLGLPARKWVQGLVESAGVPANGSFTI